MTPLEWSLFVEGRSEALRHEDERAVIAAHLGAKLARAKRIPTLFSLLKVDEKGRALPADEAEREKARHEELVKRLGGEGSEEDLKKFIREGNKSGTPSRP